MRNRHKRRYETDGRRIRDHGCRLSGLSVFHMSPFLPLPLAPFNLVLLAALSLAVCALGQALFPTIPHLLRCDEGLTPQMVRGGEAACPHADATRWCHQRSKACRDLPAWLLCRLLFDLLTLWFWCLPVGGVSLPILGPSLHPILLSISDSLSQRFWKVLASSLPQPPLPHLPYSINFPFLLLFLILGKSFGPQSLPPCWNIFSFVRSHEGLHEGHMKRVRWGHQR